MPLITSATGWLGGGGDRGVREVIGTETEDTISKDWQFSSSFVLSPLVCETFVSSDVFCGASGVESKKMGAAALQVEPPPLRHARSSSVVSG